MIYSKFVIVEFNQIPLTSEFYALDNLDLHINFFTIYRTFFTYLNGNFLLLLLLSSMYVRHLCMLPFRATNSL